MTDTGNILTDRTIANNAPKASGEKRQLWPTDPERDRLWDRALGDVPWNADLPRDRAVIYETDDSRTWQLYVPADAAVMVTQGGILVSHEESEAVRILSVRPLKREVPDVPETQHEQQG